MTTDDVSTATVGLLPKASNTDDATAQATAILVLQDESGDFGLIKSCLQQAGFCRDDHQPPLIWAKTLAQGIAQARRARPDVVLLNTSLPDSVGMSTVVAMNAALPK